MAQTWDPPPTGTDPAAVGLWTVNKWREKIFFSHRQSFCLLNKVKKNKSLKNKKKYEIIQRVEENGINKTGLFCHKKKNLKFMRMWKLLYGECPL